MRGIRIYCCRIFDLSRLNIPRPYINTCTAVFPSSHEVLRSSLNYKHLSNFFPLELVGPVIAPFESNQRVELTYISPT